MKQTAMRRDPQSKVVPFSVDAPAKGVPANASAVGGVPWDSDSKWVRLPREGFTLRGFSRSFLFQLCKAGVVESIVIPGPAISVAGRGVRKRKSDRGVRLVLLASLDNFLETQRREQNAAKDLKSEERE